MRMIKTFLDDDKKYTLVNTDLVTLVQLKSLSMSEKCHVEIQFMGGTYLRKEFDSQSDAHEFMQMFMPETKEPEEDTMTLEEFTNQLNWMKRVTGKSKNE